MRISYDRVVLDKPQCKLGNLVAIGQGFFCIFLALLDELPLEIGETLWEEKGEVQTARRGIVGLTAES